MASGHTENRRKTFAIFSVLSVVVLFSLVFTITPLSYSLEFENPIIITEPVPEIDANFGTGVAIGDINNDGHDDILVKATDSGEAFVFLGPDLSTSITLSGILPGTNGNRGLTIASGDVNNDGNDDVIVGSEFADAGAINGAGEVLVFFGPDLITTNITLTEPIPEIGANFGISVASGDVNNDGNDDVIVGARHAEQGGNPFAGEAFVFFGPNLTSSTALVPPMISTVQLFGYSVISGDINNDNNDDVIVGAPASASHNGTTFVFFGPNLSSVTTLDYPGAALPSSAFFGVSVATGDINNDNFDDIIVGANQAFLEGLSKAGEAFIIYGPDLTTTTTLTAPMNETGNEFGLFVASDDITNDGVDDILVSALNAYDIEIGSGSVFIFSGANLTDVTMVTEPVPETDATFGRFTTVGDVDNDSVNDLIVGTNGATGAGLSKAGEVFYYGNITGVSPASTLKITKITTGGDDIFDFTVVGPTSFNASINTVGSVASYDNLGSLGSDGDAFYFENDVSSNFVVNSTGIINEAVLQNGTASGHTNGEIILGTVPSTWNFLHQSAVGNNITSINLWTNGDVDGEPVYPILNTGESDDFGGAPGFSIWTQLGNGALTIVEDFSPGFPQIFDSSMTTQPADDGAWHMITIVYDKGNTTGNAYIGCIDAVCTNEGSLFTQFTGVTNDATHNMTLGGGYDFGAAVTENTFNIDDLTIWQGYQLTQSDVNSMWNGGSGSTGRSIATGSQVLHHSFDNADAQTSGGSGGMGMSGPTTVDPGIYNITEIIPSSWNLTNATCNDGSSSFSVNTVSGIIINQGDNIECTFENIFSPLSEPDQVTGLSATATGLTTIDLAWTTPADGGSPITGYQIERESPIGGGFTVLVADTGSTATTFEDTGLESEIQYNYKVSAINAIGTGSASSEVDATTFTPEEAVEDVSEDLEDIINANPGTPLADKLEDANAGIETAIDELNKTPPDNQAALGNIEGAVGDIEAAINEGLDETTANALMDTLAGIARQIAQDAIDTAIATPGSDPSEIADAQQFLADGDVLRTNEEFKDAVAKYKDALSKAESALP